MGGGAWVQATEERAAALGRERWRRGQRCSGVGTGAGSGAGGGAQDGEARGDISTGLSPPLLTTPLPPPPPPPLPFSDLVWRGFAALVARRRWWRPTGLCSSVVEAEAVEAAAGLDTGGVEAEAVEADGAR